MAPSAAGRLLLLGLSTGQSGSLFSRFPCGWHRLALIVSRFEEHSQGSHFSSAEESDWSSHRVHREESGLRLRSSL